MKYLFVNKIFITDQNLSKLFSAEKSLWRRNLHVMLTDRDFLDTNLLTLLRTLWYCFIQFRDSFIQFSSCFFILTLSSIYTYHFLPEAMTLIYLGPSFVVDDRTRLLPDVRTKLLMLHPLFDLIFTTWKSHFTAQFRTL